LAVKVLGLAASARRGGNTETLLDWCLSGAKAEGAVVVKTALSDLELHGCRACDACRNTGECIQRDDMDILYPQLREVDSIVLATPVYFLGIPAVPKMVIDRCQPLWVRKYVMGETLAGPERPERRGAYLSCAGSLYSHVFEGSQRVVRALWNTLDITPVGEVLCPGVDGKGQIMDQSGARVAAEQIGRQLGQERSPQERKVEVEKTVKTCINCGKPLVDRVEEEERTGMGVSRSTGECDTYRVWFCANSDCPMYRTDIYRESMADRTDRAGR